MGGTGAEESPQLETTTPLEVGGSIEENERNIFDNNNMSNNNTKAPVVPSTPTAAPRQSHHRLFSQREQAAMDFLGQISSFSDQLGFMMPDHHLYHQQSQADADFQQQQLMMATAANGGLTGTPTNVSAVDLLASAAAPISNSTSLPMPIPQSTAGITSPGTHQRGYPNNISLSNSSPLAAMTSPHLWSNEEAAASSLTGERSMNVSGTMLADNTVSFENATGIRSSLYKSPALARKSLNRLSNKSARSSELSLMDPLYVLTYPGGPVTLFSMMPLVKHEAKKRANVAAIAGQSVASSSRAGARGMGKGIISGATSSPYYNSFSPYLEKMGLTTINFDVKLQRKKVF